MKITPLQTSFSAGELSPMMWQRSDTEGYKQGLSDLTNMIPDPRGPAFSRAGSKYIAEYTGNNARVMAIPVNDNFFYSAVFIDQELHIASIQGHNPSSPLGINPNFNLGSDGWAEATDGHATSVVNFHIGEVEITVNNNNGRWAYIAQEITGLLIDTDYKVLWSVEGSPNATVKVGTLANDGTIYTGDTDIDIGEHTFNSTTNTTVWITVLLDAADIAVDTTVIVGYFGLVEAISVGLSFITPYLEEDLDDLHGVPSPDGSAMYVVHEKYPPYKLLYDSVLDTFSWDLVVFISPPAQWIEGNYPSTGTSYQGRLWLGGTVHEPQTFWGSKSGVYEDFTTGTNADDAVVFTMNTYGRIRWMVGFKNLLIGTQNGEHIISSEGGIITPSDIQSEQQSSYGSSAVQPVQVGDQVFYVSADGRKVRAIQYEWQADNWLSKDLTFNSEHITKAGIRHITWQQNPNNLFHCILHDGSMTTLTYNRSHNVYGWTKFVFTNDVVDLTTGPIDGTDYLNGIFIRGGKLFFETQPSYIGGNQPVDSWTETDTEADGVTVLGLDYLEGESVVVIGDGAIQPNQTVTGGQITIQYPAEIVVVGLNYTKSMTTLPFDEGSPLGSGAAWQKRWNKIYVRVLDSGKPKINGSRPATRHPSTPMGTAEPGRTENIQVASLGFSQYAPITVEQDLPLNLTVLGLFGELGQDIPS